MRWKKVVPLYFMEICGGEEAFPSHLTDKRQVVLP